MTNNEKNLKAMMIAGIMTAVGAVAAVFLRIMLISEVKGIKNSPASIFLVGSKQLSRAEALELASKEATILNIAIIFLVIISAAFFLFYNIKKKKSQ